MSHFSVAVITKGRPHEGDIALLLAPYDENKDVLHYISRETLIARTRKEIEDYKQNAYAEYLKDPEAYLAKCENEDHIKYITEEFPKQLSWTDEECYQDAIKYEDEENICPDGSLRSTYNPNSQWDWYEIGGRWAGMLTVKEDKVWSRGNPSWGHKEAGLDPYASPLVALRKCDGAFMRDLVFPTLEEDKQQAARFWEVFVEGDTPQNEEEEKIVKETFYSRKYYLDTYGTKEIYIKAMTGLHVFAIITPDGKWHQREKMGWWGFSYKDGDKDNSMQAWIEKYTSIFEEAAKNGEYVTIVDCHI